MCFGGSGLLFQGKHLLPGSTRGNVRTLRAFAVAANHIRNCSYASDTSATCGAWVEALVVICLCVCSSFFAQKRKEWSNFFLFMGRIFLFLGRISRMEGNADCFVQKGSSEQKKSPAFCRKQAYISYKILNKKPAF